jgi:hypothetical protein
LCPSAMRSCVGWRALRIYMGSAHDGKSICLAYRSRRTMPRSNQKMISQRRPAPTLPALVDLRILSMSSDSAISSDTSNICHLYPNAWSPCPCLVTHYVPELHEYPLRTSWRRPPPLRRLVSYLVSYGLHRYWRRPTLYSVRVR